MKSTSALSRTQTIVAIEAAPLPSDIAAKVALAWMDTGACETVLMQMGKSATTWQTAPAAQNAMAAMIGDLMSADTKISCVGFQAYGWMIAAGMSVSDVMRVHLGKILIQNVMPMSAEDIATAMKKGPMQIVALHVETNADWQDVRAISAAAVKAEAPLLMVISAGIPAPEGVAIDTMTNVNQAATALREAFASVRDNGAIRVLAMDDMAAGAIDHAMMNAASMTVEAWQAATRKNNDGAEIAANTAYQSPVESF